VGHAIRYCPVPQQKRLPGVDLTWILNPIQMHQCAERDTVPLRKSGECITRLHHDDRPSGRRFHQERTSIDRPARKQGTDSGYHNGEQERSPMRYSQVHREAPSGGARLAAPT